MCLIREKLGCIYSESWDACLNRPFEIPWKGKYDLSLLVLTVVIHMQLSLKIGSLKICKGIILRAYVFWQNAKLGMSTKIGGGRALGD